MSRPSATRRRGADLIAAIHVATLRELADHGFAELSFDRIAAAAGTGKAALYRRWSTTGELVMSALTDPATGFGETPAPPRTGSLRGDLMTLLGRFTELLEEPRGRALQPLIAYRYQHPQLFEQVWTSVIKPAQETLLAVLAQAVTRGEARPERAVERIASLGPQVLLMQAWRTGPLTASDVAEVVDEILLPILTAPGGHP